MRLDGVEHLLGTAADLPLKGAHNAQNMLAASALMLMISCAAFADEALTEEALTEEELAEAAETAGNLHLYASLGVRRYLSLMKTAEFVLGNSSSGIIETPAFHIPTVNIGDRQKGRLEDHAFVRHPYGRH